MDCLVVLVLRLHDVRQRPDVLPRHAADEATLPTEEEWLAGKREQYEHVVDTAELDSVVDEGRADRIGELLGLPEGKVVRVILPVGVPAKQGRRPGKLPFAERAWFNRHGG